MLLFSTDIDGTIYDGRDTARRFAEFWATMRERPEPSLLVYNTGRLLADVQQLLEATDLPRPDYVIAGVGTQIFDFGQNAMIGAWTDDLGTGWSFAAVERIVADSASGVERQPDECQNPFKSSWYWRNKGREDLDAIGRALSEGGLDTQVVYSSDRDLDILPAKANKGNAICWLSTWLEIPRENIIVAGDSGNDASMFLIERGRGILVANAEAALVEAAQWTDSHRASQPCADGVIEGLRTLVPYLELHEP